MKGKKKEKKKSHDWNSAELTILRRVRHPHIIEFREFIRPGDLLFFITEHCSGGTLFSWMSEGFLLQEGIMKRLFCEIALAVQYISIRRGLPTMASTPRPFSSVPPETQS
jgi:serine/threonine protein kinase